ncbi:hypothetical protein AB0I30_23190 [Nocardia tengchongensis]|uniref:hypothetical protein n=1 Tax=Nocardia tengchongensis TaxID=2055889 RepID=UPI0033E77A9A
MNIHIDGAGLPEHLLDAARDGLDAIAVTDVTLLVTDSFTDRVRGLDNNPDYRADRGAGVVAARTMHTSDGHIIVVNAPQLRRRDPADIERLLAHEGGHVLLGGRGEDIALRVRPARLTRWQWLLYCLGAIGIEEYRIEAALSELGYGESETCDIEHLESTMSTLNEEILGSVLDPATSGDPLELERRVIHAQQWLVKFLACVAPYRPARGLPALGVAAYARENWGDYIGEHWQRRVEFYESIPSAHEPLDATDLDVVLRRGLVLEVELLRSLGFAYTTGTGGGYGFWRRGSNELFTRRVARLRRELDDSAA